MSLVAAGKAFFRAPRERRRLALEAVWNLALARILTLVPARYYVSALGTLEAEVASSGEYVDPVAAEIGAMVTKVAGVLPINAGCLQQAIAVRRMLRRRGVAASIYLGVSRVREDRAAPELGRAAHAWVVVGGRIVSGAGDLDRYLVVARFA